MNYLKPSLIIDLREDFKLSPQYKKIYNNESFDNWDLAINTLEYWGILLPEVIVKYKKLKAIRNFSLHFNINTAVNDRNEALNIIKLMQEIIELQFSTLKRQPWILYDVPGEVYLKKEYENNPFVKHFLIPNSLYVGYKHKVESINPQWIINDNFSYEEKVISDNEFCNLRKQNK